MAHFDGCLADWNSFFGIDISTPCLSLLSGAHDGVYDFARDEDWVVVHGSFVVRKDRKGWLITEEVEATCSRTCFGLGEVGGICVDPQMHIAFFVGNYGIWVSCCIVKEMLDAGLELVPLSCRECCGHRANRMEHGGV